MIRMAAKFVTCVVLLVLIIHCESRSHDSLQKCRRSVIDLTHVLNENVPKWPLSTIEPPVTDEDYFKLTLLREDYWGENSDKWLSLKKVQFYEQVGTHMDAPSNAARGRQDMHEIPPSRLIGPGVIINVADKVQREVDTHGISNYALTVEDIDDYEEKFGKIPAGSIVIMDSGWHRRFPRPEMVFGSDAINQTYTYNYPGLSLESCQALMDRQVSIIGSDAPAIDPGQAIDPPPSDSPDWGYWWPVKDFLGKNDMPVLSFVANLDDVPPIGHDKIKIFVGGMKHEFGRAGPTRVLAEVCEIGDIEDNQ